MESQALLENYQVCIKDFLPETYEQLKKYEERCDPQTGEYQIAEEEIRGREDLRKELVFTCDPKTARDLDDALSIRPAGENIYEVSTQSNIIFQIGVHIADVSHFVKEDTPLDEEARIRTTTVYLVHKAIPMLPHLLCQNLCSLNGGLERLTFSCFFYVNNDGELVEEMGTRVTKSIIKTCIRFDYDMLQEVIEGKITDEDALPIHFYPEGTSKGDIIKNCLKMNEIAQKIRNNRFETGSLSFERNKQRFELDMNNFPIGIASEKRKHSSFMVEEYMLLANKYVAKFIIDTCKEIGVLRCHPPPSVKKISMLKAFLDKMKVEMSFDSSKDIKESLDLILENPTVPAAHKQVMLTQRYKILGSQKQNGQIDASRAILCCRG